MRATLAIPVLFAGLTLASVIPQNIRDIFHMDEKRACPHNYVLRCFIRTPSLAIPFCSSTVGVFPTPSTSFVTVTPTITTTATQTQTNTIVDTILTTEVQTATERTTVLTTIPQSTVTVSFVRRTTVTGTTNCQQTTTETVYKRAAPKTALACIADNGASPARVTSECSCFSSVWGASMVPVTETILAPAVTAGVTTATTEPLTLQTTNTVLTVTTVTETSVSTITECQATTTMP